MVMLTNACWWSYLSQLFTFSNTLTKFQYQRENMKFELDASQQWGVMLAVMMSKQPCARAMAEFVPAPQETISNIVDVVSKDGIPQNLM